MATYMCHWHPCQLFQSTKWSRAVIHILQEYLYSLWKVHNSHIFKVNKAFSQGSQQQSIQQKKPAVHNIMPPIPGNKDTSPLESHLHQDSTIQLLSSIHNFSNTSLVNIGYPTSWKKVNITVSQSPHS